MNTEGKMISFTSWLLTSQNRWAKIHAGFSVNRKKRDFPTVLRTFQWRPVCRIWILYHDRRTEIFMPRKKHSVSRNALFASKFPVQPRNSCETFHGIFSACRMAYFNVQRETFAKIHDQFAQQLQQIISLVSELYYRCAHYNKRAWDQRIGAKKRLRGDSRFSS